MQIDSKYDGQSYMEPVRNVVELNGRSVSCAENLTKNEFKTGDRVTILFRKSKFEGIVDFTKQQETIEQAESDTRTSTTKAVLYKESDSLQGSPVEEGDASNSLEGVPRSPINVPSSVAAKKCTTRKHARPPINVPSSVAAKKCTTRKHARPQSRSPKRTPQKRSRPSGTYVNVYMRTRIHVSTSRYAVVIRSPFCFMVILKICISFINST